MPASEARVNLPEAGDREGLGQALDGCRCYLLAVARRKIDPALSAKAGASDLVQDTLLEAQRDFGSFKGSSEADMLAWLRKLLLNNLSNFHRHYREAAKRSVTREVAIDTVAAHVPSVATLSDPAVSAEDNDQMRLLREHMLQLPPDYSRVLSLWYEERSFEEIGRALNRSPDAARMLWMRAVERLKDLVG